MSTQSKTIPLCEPYIGEKEREYLLRCLEDGFISTFPGPGSFLGKFEAAMCSYLNVGHAVAVTSGTAALQLALLAAGVKPDDEVLVPALTFIAPAFAVRHCGAWPVMIDVDRTYWQMDPEEVAAFLRNECISSEQGLTNKNTGRPVKAVLPVHLLGHPVDLDPILDLAAEFGLVVVEDATESLGAHYKGRPAGTMGIAGCFSFNGNKLITSGGGGMVVTNDKDLAHKVRHLSTQAKADPIEFVHDVVGYNHRLTNLQAAVGLAQLERIEQHLSQKRLIAQRYNQGLKDVPGISTLPQAAWAQSASWLYTILIDQAKYGMTGRELMAELDAEKISIRPLWQPLHRSPALSDCPTRECPAADSLHANALSLPSSVNLPQKDQQRVIDTIVQLGDHN